MPLFSFYTPWRHVFKGYSERPVKWVNVKEFKFFYLTDMGSSIEYVPKIFRKTNILTPPDTHTYVCASGGYAYQEIRNVSFSEKFAYVLNGWSLSKENTFSRLVKITSS